MMGKKNEAHTECVCVSLVLDDDAAGEAMRAASSSRAPSFHEKSISSHHPASPPPHLSDPSLPAILMALVYAAAAFKYSAALKNLLPSSFNSPTWSDRPPEGAPSAMVCRLVLVCVRAVSGVGFNPRVGVDVLSRNVRVAYAMMCGEGGAKAFSLFCFRKSVLHHASIYLRGSSSAAHWWQKREGYGSAPPIHPKPLLIQWIQL